MMVEQVAKYLIENQTRVNEIKAYSKLPGIYALFFIGTDFPLKSFEVPDHRIIYIGKTERSQQSRDANTHFKSGRTGSSTVRKSIGALLSQTIKITPIIRNLSDVEKGRTSHFKYDDSSEEIITNWILKNLAVAFYEYKQEKEAISTLEKNLIHYLKPVLNIDVSQASNPYKVYIQALRKNLGIKAHSQTTDSKNPDKLPENKHLISNPLFEKQLSVQVNKEDGNQNFSVERSGKSFIIPSNGNKITEKDISKFTIRITAEFKDYFPNKNNSVQIYVGEYCENISYQIKEGRSSLLKLGSNIMTKLNLKVNDKINFEIIENSYHLSLVEN